MATHPNELFDKNEIVCRIWGDEYLGESISIPTYIRRIREKVEENPAEPLYIETVWDHG